MGDTLSLLQVGDESPASIDSRGVNRHRAHSRSPRRLLRRACRPANRTECRCSNSAERKDKRGGIG
jgi:hypothetical protein